MACFRELTVQSRAIYVLLAVLLAWMSLVDVSYAQGEAEAPPTAIVEEGGAPAAQCGGCGRASAESQGAHHCGASAREGRPDGSAEGDTGPGKRCMRAGMVANRDADRDADGVRGTEPGVEPSVRPGMGRGMGREMGMGMGMGTGSPGRMESIHALVHSYRLDIQREVEEIEGGVVTVTRSPSNPEAARTLARHVQEMSDLLEGQGRIRGWDPVFREIFDHRSEIDLEIEWLEDGVRVTETSENPEVVKLIRAHARKVSDFVARGPAAVHEETPLPDDYSRGR